MNLSFKNFKIIGLCLIIINLFIILLFIIRFFQLRYFVRLNPDLCECQNLKIESNPTDNRTVIDNEFFDQELPYLAIVFLKFKSHSSSDNLTSGNVIKYFPLCGAVGNRKDLIIIDAISLINVLS